MQLGVTDAATAGDPRGRRTGDGSVGGQMPRTASPPPSEERVEMMYAHFDHMRNELCQVLDGARCVVNADVAVSPASVNHRSPPTTPLRTADPAPSPSGSGMMGGQGRHVSTERRTAAGMAWRQAPPLPTAPKRSRLAESLSGAVALGLAKKKQQQQQPANDPHADFFATEAALHERIQQRRRDLLAVQTKRARVEASLARQLALGQLLHANVQSLHGNAKTRDERRWMDNLLAIKVTAEAEAQRYHADLKSAKRGKSELSVASMKDLMAVSSGA